MEIADELAKRGQLKPEFANSIEECTDTSKLYVLPDGYIYAYMKMSSEYLFADYIESDGSQYIDTGVSGGTNAEYEIGLNVLDGNTNGWGILGGPKASLIPKLYGSSAHSNIIARIGSSSAPSLPDQSVTIPNTFGIPLEISYRKDNRGLYKDGAHVGTMTNGLIEAGWGDDPWIVFNSYGDLPVKGMHMRVSYLKMWTDGVLVRDYTPAVRAKDGVAGLYDRLSGQFYTNAGSGSFVFFGATSSTAGEAWINTGHAFVPADYEDSINRLEQNVKRTEKAIAEHETRIAAIEKGETADYTAAEAQSVVDRVIAAQSTRTFTFAAISDLHYGSGNYPESIIHAAQGLKYIGDRLKLDALVILGDYTDLYTASSYAAGIGDAQAVNALLADVDADILTVDGNHDFHTSGSPAVARIIHGKNDGVAWGSRIGGYYYRDFEDHKVRVIGVNTPETNANGVSCSVAQYKWFVSALDLSAKPDAADWGVIILSHHPLDWNPTDGTYRFGPILDAYVKGTSWSDGSGQVSCNFSGKNAAKIVGNFHGHIHNFKVDNIRVGSVSGNTNTGVKRICTPESCVDRPQYEGYGAVWMDDVVYAKKAGSAEDTSFCVYCVDLDARSIKAICYGAGIDRTVSY